jgi:DNA repair protein RadA/Sms
MTDKGLKEVKDPTGIWMDKDSKPQAGSAITVVIEGTRPLAIEIQSLVTESFTPTPKRVINGIEYNRGQLLLAVAQKILKLPLYKYDVFINISGGLKTNEPAADLAVLASIYSSYKNKPLPNNSVYLGEVSLLGKVRPINQAKRRMTEAKSLGLKNIYDSSRISYALGLKKLM